MDTTSIRGFAVAPGRPVESAKGQKFWVHDTGPVTGDALPVVLLHGLGATASLNWFAGFDSLGQQRRVVALDLPGHGRTPRRGRFRLEAVADQIGGLLDELGITGCIVAGYSMGGVLTQLLARRRPDLVRGIVLCATSRDFRGKPAERLRFGAISAMAIGVRLIPLTPAFLVGPVARRRGGPNWWIAAELANSSHRAVIEAASELGRFTSRSWLHELDLPATVVMTTLDRLIPPSRQARLAECLPDCGVVRLTGDHLAAGNNPTAFSKALTWAVADVARRITARADTAAA